MEKLENVQHRASIKKKSYDEIVKILKLTTLETRRKRGDLIQFYKILNELHKVEWKNKLVKTDQGSNDGPASRVSGKKGLCFHREPTNIKTIRDKFFINRTIPLWNDLPVIVKEAKTLNSFKAGLDRQSLFSTTIA